MREIELLSALAEKASQVREKTEEIEEDTNSDSEKGGSSDMRRERKITLPPDFVAAGQIHGKLQDSIKGLQDLYEKMGIFPEKKKSVPMPELPQMPHQASVTVNVVGAKEVRTELDGRGKGEQERLLIDLTAGKKRTGK